MALTYVPNVSSPSNLWQVIQDYTQNFESTFVTDIPTFVQTAEQRIYNTVQIPAIRKNETGYMTAGNRFLQLPSDWLATFSLATIDPSTLAYNFLVNKDEGFIHEAFNVTGTLGQPLYYAQFDSQTLSLGPAPDQAYQVELHYFYIPQSIVTATTTWLGTNFPEALLYGSLREAYIFMKGEADVLEMYEKKYMEAIDRLKQLGDGKNRMDTFRNVQVRVPVK